MAGSGPDHSERFFAHFRLFSNPFCIWHRCASKNQESQFWSMNWNGLKGSLAASNARSHHPPSADTWLAWPRWALLASFAHGPLNWFNVYHRFKVRFNTLKRSEVSFWTVRRLLQITCSFLEVLCILILLAIRHNIKSEVSWVQMGEFGLVGKAL